TFFIFDNGLIVHGRGAMLDSIQLFFILAALLIFALLIKKEGQKRFLYALLGLFIGLAMAVKLNAIVLGLLPLAVVAYNILFIPQKTFIKGSLVHLAICFFVIVSIFSAVYYFHIGRGEKLAEKSNYPLSGFYHRQIEEGHTASLLKFPRLLGEHLKYIPWYSKGVPAYNGCSPDENGSLATMWPFGKKTINYRWDKNEDKTRYLYLVINPVGLFVGLMAVILGLSLIFVRAFYGPLPSIVSRRHFFLIVLFTALYFSYMVAVSTLSRVMYLYHYFLPLLFAWILFFFIFDCWGERLTTKWRWRVACVLAFLQISAFIFYSPLTYYRPLTVKEFQMRNWVSWWAMKPIE
ncbi:MAG: phospholipid carrier-dependent glycosyltransferase, partial [Pseudomonadota bacterium]